MKVIGLTGPTGAGKTTACETFRRLGADIINADRSARRVTSKGMPVLDELAREFGEDILVSGELDRRELARRAFADPEKTTKLNSIIFPYIIECISSEIQAMEKMGMRVVVLDAPTLFESGCDRLCDATLAVLSAEETRFARVVQRDSLSDEDARIRISAGKDECFYKSHAGYIIYNNGNTEELEQAVRSVYADIVQL